MFEFNLFKLLCQTSVLTLIDYPFVRTHNTVGHMGKKSYSRQAMQKFTQSLSRASAVVIPSGASVRLLDFAVPEEIIVKRFVVQVLPAINASSSTAAEGSCLVSLCQSDSNNPAAGDPTDENRLIRSACGNQAAPINLDETITMRKLAGSGIHLFVENLTGADESYVAKVTLHYLEV